MDPFCDDLAWSLNDLAELARQQVHELILPEGATFEVIVDAEVEALVLIGRKADLGAIVLLDLDAANTDGHHLDRAVTDLALRLSNGHLRPCGPAGVLPVEVHIRTTGWWTPVHGSDDIRPLGMPDLTIRSLLSDDGHGG